MPVPLAWLVADCGPVGFVAVGKGHHWSLLGVVLVFRASLES
jgi:hypothetical protein